LLARAWHALRAEQSGPAVARLFHRLLGGIYLVAWISLGVQIRVLIGRRGLLPIAEYLRLARVQGSPTPLSFPTFLWLDASDAALLWGIAVGVLLAVLVLLGRRPRLCLGLSAALYLGYATACRAFLGFQWDNLLIEAGVLGVLLPDDRPALLSHALMRLLLFKVYFESGVAKWMSYLHDWTDGSAMSLYYETAPLPTPLGHRAHALPAAWHRFESWSSLVLELFVPFFIFGPRSLRRIALVAFTVFQIADAATANYGFFCYTVAVLGVFLLDDRDVAPIAARIRRTKVKQESAAAPGRARSIAGRTVTTAAATVWVWISFTEGMAFFDRDPAASWDVAAQALAPYVDPLRVANTYHLFGSVTRERIEPEFQTWDGRAWTGHDLCYKPGDPSRPPPWVAPHQPRVDFLLWFYGLGYRRTAPPYVTALLERMCSAPDAVNSLFAAPLPAAPLAVRIAYWRYHFTTPAERRRTGAWWKREWVGAGREIACPTPLPAT
jgi:lipase maturation factor 1